MLSFSSHQSFFCFSGCARCIEWQEVRVIALIGRKAGETSTHFGFEANSTNTRHNLALHRTENTIEYWELFVPRHCIFPPALPAELGKWSTLQDPSMAGQARRSKVEHQKRVPNRLTMLENILHVHRVWRNLHPNPLWEQRTALCLSWSNSCRSCWYQLDPTFVASSSMALQQAAQCSVSWNHMQRASVDHGKLRANFMA